jgi:calcium-dependent protein kinase
MYVVKIQTKVKLRAEDEATFRCGIERLMNMKENGHVAKVHGCFEDSHYFYTLQEECEGGSLLDFFELLEDKSVDDETRENEVRKVMKEVLTALDHLHKQGLFHKDVKLDNLVFKNKATLTPRLPFQKQAGLRRRPTSLKLIDFDSIQEHNAARSNKLVLGTDGYIAPEAYLGNACPKGDIFSAGVVMFSLLSGVEPFNLDMFDDGPGENFAGSRKMALICRRLVHTKVKFGKRWKNMDSAKQFCQALMHYDVDKRMTAEEALKHPWMETLTQGEAKEEKYFRF